MTVAAHPCIRAWPRPAAMLLVVAAACAPKAHAVVAPVHPPSNPPVAGSAAAFHGYLGRSLIDADIVATEAGFQGCYRELGTNARARLVGTLGAELTPPTGAQASPDADAGAQASPDADAGEAHVFDCRFEVRSDIVRLGGIVARCAALASPNARAWELNGAFYAVKDGAAAPFYLGPTSFPSVPDDLMLTLARAEAPPRACAPFIDVLDVKALPGDRRAVLYARSFPCEAEAQNPGEERAAPDLARLRVALFATSDLAHARVVPLSVDDDAEAVELHVYELAAGQELFELERSDEGLAGGSGHGYVNTRRTLFALTRSGRAGPLLELPEVQSADGCSAYDALSLERAELDGDAPPELVLATANVRKPCNQSAAEPSEPSSFTYVAYSFDPELARFAPLSVETDEIGRRELTPLDDISGPDDAWQAPRSEQACSVPVAH